MKIITLKLFALLVLFSITLTFSHMYIEENYFRQTAEDIALENGAKKLKEREAFVKRFFNDSKNLLHSIRDLESFDEYLKNKSNQKLLEDIFLSYVKSQSNFMKLRYIDKNGFEKINIIRDENQKNPYILKSENLQNKEDTYYFINSKSKELEKIWFSKINEDATPTLRAILPIQHNEKFNGILVIDYFLYDFLVEVTKSPLYDMIIFDDKGETFYHFAQKQNIKTDFPNDYQKILSSPLLKTTHFVSKKLETPLDGGFNIILQFHKSYLADKEKLDKHQDILETFLIFILTFIFSFFFFKIFQQVFQDVDKFKKLSEEIQKEQIKFSSLYNYSLDAILLLDFEKGRFEDINPKACEIYGYTKEEFLQLGAKDLDAIHDENHIKSRQKDIIEQGWAKFETKHKLKNGTIIDVRVSAKAITLFEKKYLYVSIRNITTQKELERELIKEKDFVSTIIDSANAIIAVIDNDGRMFKVNQYTENFTRYTKEEIASEPFFWTRFLPEDKRLKVLEVFEKANHGEIIKSFKNSWFSKNGEERVFEWSNTLVQNEDGTINYLATIGIDVTEKELVQKQILEQKEEFESVFKYSKDGIAITDLETNFIDFNDAYREMTGFTREELFTKSCISLTLPELQEKSREKIQNVLLSGHIENFEKECIVKGGKRIITNMSISLLPDKKRLLILVKDVTSLKLLENQLRLASMGEMIGNIAHQWRQPLSVISTSATGLIFQQEYGMISEQKIIDTCNQINTNAQYLSRTIDDFRNFIKGDKDFEEVSIIDIIHRALNIADSTIKNNYIQLVLVAEDDIIIEGSTNELQQVIINIINNAKDILKEKSLEDDRFIFVSTHKIDEETLHLKICDSGGGIPQDIIPKIFDPYFTTKHQSQGTGLGLSMVDKIIRERHNQTIMVHNEIFNYNNKDYKGACFTIAFKK